MIYANKRSEMEIIYEILSYAIDDINKTRLMYKTNLCYTLFDSYWTFLLEKEFLGIKQGNPVGKLYYTTDKGKNFLLDINTVLYNVK